MRQGMGPCGMPDFICWDADWALPLEQQIDTDSRWILKSPQFMVFDAVSRQFLYEKLVIYKGEWTLLL